MKVFSPKTTLSTSAWMGELARSKNKFKNNTLLDITIPGSHDAATYTMTSSPAAKFAVTQTKSLRKQFELGVRYFDIRMHRTKATLKKQENELQFFHGMIKSTKESVFPNMMDFLTAILNSNEIVILKLHFNAPEDFDLFREIYLQSHFLNIIIPPKKTSHAPVGHLIKKNKRLLLLTTKGGKDSSIHSDYKSNTYGGWAKTRCLNELANKMNKVRSTVDPGNAGKLKIIQTNQPAIVGTGSARFLSVLEQDRKPSCRLVVEKFVDESENLLKVAASSNHASTFKKVKQISSGIISMDNIGSDENKNNIIRKIINLNTLL